MGIGHWYWDSGCSGVGFGYFRYLYCRFRSYRFSVSLTSSSLRPLPPPSPPYGLASSSVVAVASRQTGNNVRSRKVENRGC